MTKYRNLELEAYEELRAYLEDNPRHEPLQSYITERLEEAGDDSRERLRVMMELVRFQVFLEGLPEYQALKDYVDEVRKERRRWHKRAA
jgi:hypothetical protein